MHDQGEGKRSSPNSQFTRVSRIVSYPIDKTLRLAQMATKFKGRGYPIELLNYNYGNSDFNHCIP